MKLDAKTLATLTLPSGKREARFFDERLAGHGVRLRHPTDQSKWRWITQTDIAGRTQIITNGPVPLLSPGQAFNRSRDLLASVRLGENPAEAKRLSRRQAGETFGGAILKRYLISRQHDCRHTTFKQVERRLVKLARSLHPLPISSIDRRTLADLLTTVAADRGRSAAANLHASLSGYFGWLVGEGLLDASPMTHANKPDPGPARDRVPTEDELRALWNALGNDDYGDIVRLIVLCASRRSEVGDLKWAEINFVSGLIEIPAARMKAGKAHVIPLSEPALAILRRRSRNGRDYVFGSGQGGFQGWSAARTALDKRLTGPRATWTLHDFRRLASTVMNGTLKVQPHVVERVLAHIQRGVGPIYNRHEYIDERKAALALWAEYVTKVVSSPSAAAVVQLASRSA
jgi:integrase